MLLHMTLRPEWLWIISDRLEMFNSTLDVLMTWCHNWMNVQLKQTWFIGLRNGLNPKLKEQVLIHSSTTDMHQNLTMVRGLAASLGAIVDENGKRGQLSGAEGRVFKKQKTQPPGQGGKAAGQQTKPRGDIPRGPRDLKDVVCHNCKQKGHLMRDCPNPRAPRGNDPGAGPSNPK